MYVGELRTRGRSCETTAGAEHCLIPDRRPGVDVPTVSTRRDGGCREGSSGTLKASCRRRAESVMETVARIGGTVVLEPDPMPVLEGMSTVADVDEFSGWMRDYYAGRLILVRLELFAETRADPGVRVAGPIVRGLSFTMPHGDDNVAHAREMVAMYVDELLETLQDRGLRAGSDVLAGAAITIELDAEAAERLVA